MKRVVNDLLYDTETSELLYTEVDTQRKLYRTQNNHFFTFYKNGEIVPKSEEDTKDYLGRVDVDTYIKVFGQPEKA